MQHTRYMPGLDGLRAMAVAVVMIYHLNYSWAPGGLLGVGIFFVLSGFLISDILFQQWKQLQKLDFKVFWIRRVKRLLPALFTMLITVIVWCCFFDRSQLPVLRQDSLAAVLYVSNWWYIFHKVSYFQSFGQPSPLGHLWSLAVEEQFYLIFPLLLWVMVRWFSKFKWLIVVFCLGLAAISAYSMSWIYQPGEDPSRVYYGTDTRAFALLIGCSLAILCPSQLVIRYYSAMTKFLVDLLGFVCFLVLLAFIFQISEYNPLLYQGGFVYFSIITAILIFVIVQPTSLLGKCFSWGPFKWLGARSYGIYLWHFPIIVLSSPVNNIGGIDWIRVALQIFITVVLAAVSYRWIENPIRHGVISRPLMMKSSMAILVGVLCLVLPIPKLGVPFIESTVVSNTKEVTHSESTKKHQSNLESTRKAKTEPKSTTPTQPKKNQNQSPISSSNPKSDPIFKNESLTSDQTPLALPVGTQVTSIGDSIMLDIEPNLKRMIPGIVVDGKVGRQLFEAPREIANLKSTGQLGNIIVIELGTNGSFTLGQLQNLYQSLGNPKQVIFVNTRVPRPWESDVNSMLSKFVENTPHTTLVDWYTKSANQSGYFASDGVHLTPSGSLMLARMIKNAIHP